MIRCLLQRSHRPPLMHVALLIDGARLAQEQAMLNRLCIGLMAEGLQITRIVPDDLDDARLGEGEQRIALAARFEAPMKVLPWMRGARVQRLVEELDDRVPDVLYAIGRQTWDLAIGLSEAISRPTLIDVWSLEHERWLPTLKTAASLAGYVTPCRGIEAQLERRFGGEHVDLAPMGVSIPPRPAEALAAPERSIAIAVLGAARDLAAYRALFGGLKSVIDRRPTLQVILELPGGQDDDVWRFAEQAGLIARVSAIGDATEHRRLLTQCDLIVMPERTRELRSVLLECMAAARPVACAASEPLDMLRDGETAQVVKAPSPDTWAQTLERMLANPAETRALGAAGRDHVSKSHRSSQQVERMVQSLEQVRSGGPYRFSASKSPK